MLSTDSSPTMVGLGSSSIVRGVQGHRGLEPEFVCAADRDRDCSSPSSDRADSTLVDKSGMDFDSRLRRSRRDPEFVLFWLCSRGLLRDLV